VLRRQDYVGTGRDEEKKLCLGNQNMTTIYQVEEEEDYFPGKRGRDGEGLPETTSEKSARSNGKRQARG